MCRKHFILSPLEHIADVEVQICLNQLIYAGLAEAIRNRKFSQLEGLEFDKIKEEGCFIVESRKKFRKMIEPSSNLNGEIKFENFREMKNLLYVTSSFNFQDRACVGDLDLVIVKG